MADLDVRHILKIYGKRRVVNDVSLKIHSGEIVGLLGPNGAGKTTTFYMITGMVRPNRGDIFYNGQNITHLPMYRRARLGLGYLPQEASVFRKLSVEDNIMLVLESLKLSREERESELNRLLDELNIQHIRKNISQTLSGGERRRTEIARSLATKPDFILLDEPFAGVDPIAVEDIQAIVRGLKTKGIGVIITDHNVRETLSITDRSYLLFEGRILREGPSRELAEDEEARRLYLGTNFKLN